MKLKTTKKNKSKKAAKSKKLVKKIVITKDMTFMDVMNLNPKAAWVLMENGMHCAGCGFAAQETLEQGALAHGLDPNKLIKKLNKTL